MTMHIQLLSDLHVEFLDKRPSYATYRTFDAHPDADVIVLAGDIDAGWQSLEFASKLTQRACRPVIWLPGNHEFYQHDFDALRSRFEHSDCEGVHVLMNRTVVLGGVRFVGGTLWTDFALYEGSPRLNTREQAMELAEGSLADFRVIKRGNRRFSPMDSAVDHAATRAFLERELATPFPGKTVVVTHHAPHPRSIHPRYAAREDVLASRRPLNVREETSYWYLNPCFASRLEPLIEQADLWLHGHMHDSVDYQLGRCRVVANPRGYPRFNPHNDYPRLPPVFENENFEPQKIIVTSDCGARHE